MSTNVEPEEAQAIREILVDESSSSRELSQRDFNQPRRLSSTVLEELERVVQSVLADLEARVCEVSGTRCVVRFERLSEVAVDDLFDDETEPLAALRVMSAGQPGWALWDCAAAVETIERVLGSQPQEPELRALSSIECTVLESILATVVESVAGALELEMTTTGVVTTLDGLGSWLEGGDDADPHRLRVELSLGSPEAAGAVSVYLPAPTLESPLSSAGGGGLPDHLDEVVVDACVRLEGADVALDQLLALEEGDVIPLDGRVGGPAQLVVEGRLLGSGLLGQSEGHIAIRIEHLEEDLEQDDE